MENEQLATFSVNGWLPNGMKVYFTIPLPNGVSAFDQAFMFTNGLLEKGFAQTEPGLEDGEQSEPILVVMRRAKSDGTPIIDFYPAWGVGSEEPFGTYKYLHKYLNDDTEINEFLTVAGFKSLEDIPLYDAQSPLKRTPNKRHAKETPVNKPFKIVRKQGIEKTGSDGQPYRPWELVRYEPVGNVLPLDTTANGAQSNGSGEKSAADKLMGNGHDQPRNLVKNAEKGAVVSNSDNPDGVWEYDLPALMAHPDLITAYPKYPHRANAINLLHDAGYFNNVTTISAAVKIVLSRPDKQDVPA